MPEAASSADAGSLPKRPATAVWLEETLRPSLLSSFFCAQLGRSTPLVLGPFDHRALSTRIDSAPPVPPRRSTVRRARGQSDEQRAGDVRRRGLCLERVLRGDARAKGRGRRRTTTDQAPAGLRSRQACTSCNLLLLNLAPTFALPFPFQAPAARPFVRPWSLLPRRSSPLPPYL